MTPDSHLESQLLLFGLNGYLSELQSQGVTSEWFQDLSFKAAWVASESLANQGKPTTVSTVETALAAQGLEFASIGILKGKDTPRTEALGDILQACKEKHHKRHWSRKAKVLEDAIKTAKGSPVELLGRFVSEIHDFEQSQGVTTESLQDELPGWLEHFREVQDGTCDPGLQTGIRVIDELTTGLYPQQLCIIGARPSVGKTATLLNVAVRLSRDIPLGFFSLEMSSKQLISRIVAMRAGVDSKNLRVANGLTEGEFSRVSQAFQDVNAGNRIYIKDKSDMGIGYMRAVARSWVHHKGVKAILVDYLQLIKGNAKSPRERVADASVGLKQMAKELNVPVIAAAQINRGSEQEERPPKLSDLKESGQIEQDADVCLLLHPDQETHKLDIILAKQRDGATGVATVDFNKPTGRIMDIRQQSDIGETE